MGEMICYIVKTNLRYRGKEYEPGSPIKLTAEQAQAFPEGSIESVDKLVVGIDLGIDMVVKENSDLAEQLREAQASIKRLSEELDKAHTTKDELEGALLKAKAQIAELEKKPKSKAAAAKVS